MKGCSASLASRETKTKTTMRYHFTLVRMTVINKSINIKLGIKSCFGAMGFKVIFFLPVAFFFKKKQYYKGERIVS